MALLISFLLFLIPQISFSEVNSIYLELGEEFKLLNSTKRVWIEEKSVLVGLINKKRAVLSAKKVGKSLVRINDEIYTFFIVPAGYKKTKLVLDSHKKHFIDLNFSNCSLQICIKGTIYNFEEYLRLVQVLSQIPISIYNQIKISEDLKKKISKYLENRFRSEGITPLKIQFDHTWTVFHHDIKLLSQETKTFINNHGLQIKSSSTKFQIQDNVKLSVKIMEISKNFDQKIGLNWPDSFQANLLNSSSAKANDPLAIIIRAAEKNGDAKTLSSPNIICRSGKEAQFFAGGEFPIKIISTESNQVMWKKFGIALKFKPLVDSVGQMSLYIETEISTLNRSITVDDIPAVQTNLVSSFFDLINSKTIVLSGLIHSQSSENTEGLPYLKNIPIIGELFRSKNFQNNKSQLVVLVTPELMLQN